MVPKSMADPYYTSNASSVQTEKISKNSFVSWTSSQKEEIRTGKSKALEDAFVKEGDFLLVPMRRKELTWS